MREWLFRFIRSLRCAKGSQTIEYIVIIAAGILFATILQNVIQSEPVQEAIVEKIRCAILFSGEGCTDPQIASGDTKTTANDNPPPVEYNQPDPPIPPVPPQPPVQRISQRQDSEQPWYPCLLSLECLKKKAGETVDEITGFIVRYMEDLEKAALQHCGQDAECISDYITKKKLSLYLHLNPGLGLLSLGIEKLTGWSLLDAVAGYIVEHPFEAAFIALCTVLIPFTGGASAVAGAVGTGATGSVLGGLGAAGIAFLGRRLALRFFPRIAAFVASRIPLPPWATRFLPLGMEGGFTATAEQGWFDFIRDGRVNWKNALIGGLLGAGIGFAFPVVAPHVADGIGIGLKQIRQLPVAFEVTTDGAIVAKRLGDTGIGRKLEDAGDAMRRFAGSGDEVGTIPHSRNDLLESIELPTQNTDEAYKSYFETVLGKRLKRVKGTDLGLPNSPVHIPGEVLAQLVKDGRIRRGVPHELESLIRNYKPKKIQLEKNLIVIIDKHTMKHILESHHPKYFDPSSRFNVKRGKVTSVKDTTLFPGDFTEKDIEQIIIKIIRQERDQISRLANTRSPRAQFQIGKENGEEIIVDGIPYVLGFREEQISNGTRYRRIDQLYPRVDE